MQNVVSLDDLFHNRIFSIPDYQRGYSWELRQIREFLEDLEILKEESYHYTGTVVLHSLQTSKVHDAQGRQYDSVAIVDGQQRLTTIVILLNEICRMLKELSEENNELANGILSNFIHVKRKNGETLYKLSLNSDNDHFYKHCIITDSDVIEGPAIASHNRLLYAMEHMRKYMADQMSHINGGGVEWLSNLYGKISNQVKFTTYEIEREAEVGIIFEVMNDRGKPLTELEKVKNYLLHVSASLANANIPNELGKTVNDAWSAILSQLMYAKLESSTDEDRLLRASWLTNNNPQSRDWHGSRSVKDRFRYRDFQGKEEIVLNQLHTYTLQLREDCISFCDAYDPKRSNAFQSFESNTQLRSEIIEWSDKLVRIGVVAPFLPILFATRKRWPQKPDIYLKLLKLCEVFAFRVYLASGSRADAGQAALYRLGYEVRNTRLGFDRLVLYIKAELERLCTDSDFRGIMKSKEDEWYPWGGLKYFLYEYEIELARKKGASPKVSWENIQSRDLKDTIEHILPQNITRRPYWKQRFSMKEHKYYVNNLGNLSLTKFNSNLSDKPFPEKKGSSGSEERCYMNSSFFMEQELARLRNWTKTSIEKRRNDLVKWSISRWRVD